GCTPKNVDGIARRFCWNRPVARQRGNLRSDFVFGGATHARDRRADGAGRATRRRFASRHRSRSEAGRHWNCDWFGPRFDLDTDLGRAALQRRRLRRDDIYFRYDCTRSHRLARQLCPRASCNPRWSDDCAQPQRLMIKLKSLERSYALAQGKFFYVLRDIDIEVAEGEFVSVMGPSGAGKSTLLHILGMHDHGWTGEYFFKETAVHHLKAKERAALRNEQIGFVFQQYHLLDDLTVYENLEIPLS